MRTVRPRPSTIMLWRCAALLAIAAIAGLGVRSALTADTPFGPSNPFYAPSALPFQAPPFDKIKDADYQPAIEAGMAEQRKEMHAIADNPAPPTFENTIVAMEKTGQLLHRVSNVFDGVTRANPNPTLQKVKDIEAPKLAAHHDAIFLDPKLFQRVSADLQTTRVRSSSIPNRCACSNSSTKNSCTPAPTSSRRQGEPEKAERRGVHAFHRLRIQAARRRQGRGLRHHG